MVVMTRAARLTLAVLLLVVGRAPASALHAEARLRGDTVTVAVFFADDTPARGAAVAVRAKDGAEIAAGRTDEAGRWSFPRPAAGKYDLSADAGAGQRVRVTVTVPTDTVLKTLAPLPEEIVVTGGPSREELTRLPWLRAALGVAAVGGLAVLLWLAGRGKGASRPMAGEADDFTERPQSG
jgi:hypothetical protein